MWQSGCCITDVEFVLTHPAWMLLLVLQLLNESQLSLLMPPAILTMLFIAFRLLLSYGVCTILLASVVCNYWQTSIVYLPPQLLGRMIRDRWCMKKYWRIIQGGPKNWTKFDHPWSGVAYNCRCVCLFVCPSDDNFQIHWPGLTYEVHFRTSDISLENTGHLRIWRSSGQGQGHRSKKGSKIPIPAM